MALAHSQELMQLGLTEGEAKVYLALLTLGPSTVGPVVRKSGVAYSNIYEILQRLLEKGIVSYIMKEKTKHFQASNPANLTQYLERKAQEVAMQQTHLQKLAPMLMALQEQEQLEAEVFVGTRGLRTAYERLLISPDRYCYLYIHDAAYAAEADTFYLGIRQILGAQYARGVCNRQARTSAFFKAIPKRMRVRYAEFPIPGNIEINGDRMLIVSWETPVNAVLIHSQNIATHFRRYFEAAWAAAKP